MSEPLSLAALAAAQRHFDWKATRRFPTLFALKRSKMLSSPHAFLRGSAPLFYELLRKRPDLRRPLPGRGWIDGDMHLENFGAFRTDDGRVVFDLNDFDEALPSAPWSDDLLRLCASCFLSAGFTGQAGANLVAVVGELLEAHARAAFSRAAPRAPHWPRPVAFLLARAADRTKSHMLQIRAPIQDARHRFARGTKYLALPPAVKREVPALLAQYATLLGHGAPGHLERHVLEDAAQRIAGTGSLGVTRIAALVRAHRRVFLYDLKEARPASSGLVALPHSVAAMRACGFATEAERLVHGARALLTNPPRRLAALRDRRLGLSFVARQFTPSEDRLDLTTLQPGELGKTVETLGFLLGRAHRRAAIDAPRKSWSDRVRRDLMQRASELASLIEGAYLASAFIP